MQESSSFPICPSWSQVRYINEVIIDVRLLRAETIKEMVANMSAIFSRLVVEFPATGGALTSFQIHSVKLLRYVSYYDYFLASCEVAFCLFILTFIIQEAIEITRLKMEYFRSAWNWLDMLLIAVSCSSVLSCSPVQASTSQDTSQIRTIQTLLPG